ncbi:hypothetical protein CsSME_00001449 [Camellia sinensis var. sinensis]
MAAGRRHYRRNPTRQTDTYFDNNEFGTVGEAISDERLRLMAYIVLSKRYSSLQAMADAAHPAFILETRKTAPGLRLVDKWVVEGRII